MTHAMLRGSNVQLEAASLRAVLCWSPGGTAPDIDASALLLGEDGRVRSDEDFVFYNQPQHPVEPVRHLAKERTAEGMRDSVEARLGSLDASVERVMLSASSDGGTFADVAELQLLIYGTGEDGEPEDEPFALFDIEPETGSETAIICGELYRRGDAWKFRALGQGYETGLVGLATEFGISVESGEADERSAAAPDDARAEAPPAPEDDPDATVAAVGLPPDPEDDFPLPAPRPQAIPDMPAGPPAMPPGPPSVPPPVPSPAASHEPDTQAGAAAFMVPGSHGEPGRADRPDAPGYDTQGPTQAVQHGYGYPQRPQHPPATQPAYGYPQPAYGYPQPDPNFTLPPQGPQFIGQ